jgi:hypothetical protein
MVDLDFQETLLEPYNASHWAFTWLYFAPLAYNARTFIERQISPGVEPYLLCSCYVLGLSPVEPRLKRTRTKLYFFLHNKIKSLVVKEKID